MDVTVSFVHSVSATGINGKGGILVYLEQTERCSFGRVLGLPLGMGENAFFWRLIFGASLF